MDMKGDNHTVGVVGYILSNDHEKVVLLRKAKGPTWMRGKWNGVGGKLNEIDGGIPSIAMSRECLEETGVSICPDDWKEITIETFPDFTLHVFYTIGDYDVKKQPNEEEEPRWISLANFDAMKDQLVDGVYNHIDDMLLISLND